MPTQCLASTGSNLLAVLGIGFVLAVIGFFLLRSAKGRAAVMVLVLVGGGLLFSQATSKPASAACVASSATTMPAPTTTTAPSGTTTTTTAPAAGFTFKFNLTAAAQTTFTGTGCSGFTAAFKESSQPGPGTELVNANSSFPTTLFQSVPVPVTANTNYTVSYAWVCTGDPTNLFDWYGSAGSNIPGPVGTGSINVSPSPPYTWTSSASFTTGPDVSAPTGIQMTYTNVPV